MVNCVDLNCDIGEGYGMYTLGQDQEIMPYITTANIACGAHAGDPDTMAATVACALRHGVTLCAHPGYPDLLGFGRRSMRMTAPEIRHQLLFQLGALSAFARAAGGHVQALKLHGALSNDALAQALQGDFTIVDAVSLAVRQWDASLVMISYGMSPMSRRWREQGLQVAEEWYLDRAYCPDGSLVPRAHPQAVLHDPQEIAQRALTLVTQRRVPTLQGGWLENLTVDTLCVHGDTPAACAIIHHVRDVFRDHNIRILPFCAR